MPENACPLLNPQHYGSPGKGGSALSILSVRELATNCPWLCGHRHPQRRVLPKLPQIEHGGPAEYAVVSVRLAW